jgi:2-iminobutanoate/2-iminopropanoate deaminase
MTMSARRRSLELPGLSHNVPIPMGSRVGNVIYSSAISGKNADTGVLSEDPAEQARQAFRNMRLLLEQGGATLEDVVRVSVYLKELGVREAIAAPWLEYFPDPHSRPARHAVVTDLRNGMLLQIEFVAVVEDGR